MGDDIKLATTTDSPQQVAAAVGVEAIPEPEQPGTEQEQPADQQVQATAPAPQEPERRGKSAFQKRLDKITKEKYTYMAERDAALARLSQYETRGPAEPAPFEQPAPQPAWQERQQPAALDAHTQRVSEARRVYQDWDTVLAGVQDVPVSPQIADAILSDPNSADLQYLAAKFPELRSDLFKSPENVRKFSAALSQQKAERNHPQAIVQSIVNHPDYQAKLKETYARHDDIEEILEAVAEMPQAPASNYALLRAGNPEIIVWLVRNPDAYLKLLGMNAETALIEVGRIGAMLDRERGHAPAVRPVGNAPPAINPVRSSPTRSSLPLDQMDMPDFKRIRNQQEKEWRAGIRRE